jgi:O-antigen ligase
MTLIALAFAGLLLVLSARFWRIGTWAALVLMIYEGALRKWFLPQFQEHIYFLKDILLLGAYVGCFFGARLMRNRPLVQRHAANVIIALYAAFCLLQVLNPRLPNWKIGLYGFESYLFYIPLMYMVPELLPDERTLRRFVTGLLAVSAVPLVLGLVQFNLPADHPLNRYVWSDQAIATFGAGLDHARVTSTFSYITGYSAFLTGLAVVLLAVALFERRRGIRVLLYGALLLTVADLLMTGSRAPVAQFALAAPVVVLFTLASSAKRHVRAALVALVALALLGFGVATFFADAHHAFADRVVTNDTENVERVARLWTGTLDAIHNGGVVGYGIGATLPGSTFLNDSGPTADGPPWVEAELEHVVVETGLVGFLLTLAVRILLPLQLYRSLRQFPQSNARPLLAAALVFVIINLPMQIIVSRTAGMMYWFMAGFAFIPGRWALAHADRVYARRISMAQPLPNLAIGRSF